MVRAPNYKIKKSISYPRVRVKKIGWLPPSSSTAVVSVVAPWLLRSRGWFFHPPFSPRSPLFPRFPAAPRIAHSSSLFLLRVQSLPGTLSGEVRRGWCARECCHERGWAARRRITDNGRNCATLFRCAYCVSWIFIRCMRPILMDF